MGRILKAFDGLPFHADGAMRARAWLPSASDVDHAAAGVLPQIQAARVADGESILDGLKAALHSETAALQREAASGSSAADGHADGSHFEIRDRGEGLQQLVWRDAGRSPEGRLDGAFELSAQRLEWLRTQHAQMERRAAPDADDDALEAAF
eukprot:2626952-Prymnesium_polylepis.1